MDKVILIPHCLLNPVVNKLDKIEPPMELIEFLIKEKVAIVQMPCPELGYYSMDRSPKTRDMYDTGYKKVCRSYAEYLVKLVSKMSKENKKLIGVIGIKNSPSCGVNHTIVGSSWSMRRKSRGIGVFMQELREKLKHSGFDVSFVDYDVENPNESFKKIRRIVENA